MSEFEFQRLSLSGRADVLWSKGEYLGEVIYYRQQVKLYSLFSFFVEVWYNPDKGMIEKIEIATNSDLNKYLGRIKIDTF
jgi:hypothetical protein